MASEELSAGELVGSYRVVRKVGEGGMGEVYEAWDENLNRSVAIKIMNDKASRDAEMTERFRAEGRVLARLRHPNVVALYAQGEHNGCPYMAMEFVEGMTVDEFLIHHPCSLTALVDFFRQMLEGLGAAHAAGVVHRDIKPQNIIVGQDLQVKIIDFGVAKDHADYSSHQTTLNMVVGTAHYFAPELVTGKMANPQTDLFSLGLVFHYMITGERPFDGKGNLEILEKIRTTDVVLSSKTTTLLPEALRNVLARLTKRNPALRFRTAQEALSELDAVDLNELPADLCVAPSPRLFLANAAEVRRLCKDQQLSWFESRFAVNLAIDAMKTEPADADATQRIDTVPVVTLTDAAVMEGIRRYRLARSTMISRKSMSQAYYIEPRPRTTANSRLGFGLLVLTAVAGWAWTTMQPQTPVSPGPVPAASKPAQIPNANAKVNKPPPVEAAKPDTAARREASVSEDSDPGIPLPNLKIGTKFSVRTQALSEDGAVRHSKVKEWVLDSDEGGVSTFRSEKGGVWEELRDGFSPILNYVPPADDEINKILHLKNEIKGNPLEIFPLKIGKSTTYEVSTTENMINREVARYKFMHTCRVVKMEKVTVGAGQFDTAVIECHGDRFPFFYNKIYYAPRLQRWVRSETKTRNERNQFDRHIVFEIVGFSLPL